MEEGRAGAGSRASSIYWHLKDKDDLIAAVIERSFVTGSQRGSSRTKVHAPDRMKGMAMQIASWYFWTPPTSSASD